MEDEHKLTKKEKKELRKLEWQEKAKLEERNAKIKKFSLWAVVAGVFLIVAFVLFEAVSAPTTPTQNIKIAPVSVRDIKEGNPKAKVTLMEYADFQCPACATFHPVVNQLLKNYDGKIQYVYRMFPLEQAHKNALISAQAAYAANKQNAFFQYDDMLFNRQTEWADLQDPTTAFVDFAILLKLDSAKFKTDMNSQEALNYVKASENEALTEGIIQTPTFFINGQIIQNPSSYEDFKKLIDAALNSK